MKISNQPPKGTKDWLPQEFQIRKYIFDIWRETCLKYGYEEYLTPVIENVKIYKAKSGEDVGNKELMSFQDKAGRELCLRPEMTPSVTRLVSQIYNTNSKPIKYFSIANFWRNEKPQRGRSREFWGLNFDCFGSNSIQTDIEIVQITLDIMLKFNPPKKSFIFYLNNRKLINGVLKNIENKIEVVRILDKWGKLKQDDFKIRLKKCGLKVETVDKLINFMKAKNINELINTIPELKNNLGLQEINQVINNLKKLGYGEWIEFNPSVIRGFDYYDGLVFECFDKHSNNNRSMFGGGRYNGLSEIFGIKSLPAVGCCPGDETTLLFLKSWNLLDQIKEKIKAEKYYLPILDNNLLFEYQKLAQKLRKDKNIELGFEEQKINKALEYANKKKIDFVIILGQKELNKNIYKIKNMKTGQEIIENK